jgi:AraC family transcriptional regulator
VWQNLVVWVDRALGTPLSSPVPDESAFQNLIRYIDDHLTGDVSNATLADLAFMSESCFSRWFRAQAGVPPHVYVRAKRVERGSELIATTSLTFGEIALKVGFTSQACLNVAFSACVGTTPGEYRARFQPKNERLA